MENAIIVRAENQFKSKALNTATNGLKKAFLAMENGKKDACAILAKVEANKTYADDGFKSLAEYGEAIGLNKSLVHKMENAGRLLISENQAIKDFANNTDFSKLAIVSSADSNAIENAINSGDLKPEMTQREVAEWKSTANAKKAKQGETVLPKFEVWISDGNHITHYDAIELENVHEINDKDVVKVGTVQFCDAKWTVYANIFSGYLFRVKTDKIKKSKKPVMKSLKNLTADDLRRMLAELEAKESEPEEDELEEAD